MWAMLDGQLTGEPWSDNFPNWGTMRNGELIPLPTPGHLISGADGGFWGTPTVNDSKNTQGESQQKRHGPSLHVQAMWNTPNTMDSLSAKSQDALDYEHRTARPGRSNPNNLRDQVAVDEGQRIWPSPMASDAIGNRTTKGKDRPDEGGLLQAAKMWPTPKSTRSGPDYAREEREGSGGDDLATFVVKEEPTSSGGALSADWVEWLMGVPQGWSIAEPCADYDTWLRQQLAASHWLEEQGLPRTIVGQENRVSRLKMLGNGIVPSAAAMAIKELSARLLQE